MNVWIAAFLVALCAYLLGSLSFAVIVSRLCAKEDVRTHGSGNAGMTNILRTYGKGLATLTLLGDFGKGVAAVLLGRLLFYLFGVADPLIDPAYIAGFFVLLGHLYPVFFGFHGGKGVLVSAGVILCIDPIVLLALVVIIVPFMFIVKIVSLGSILAAVLYPVLTLAVMLLRHQNPLFATVFACLIGGIVIFMHRSNIKKLLNGTEYKFGQKPKD